VGGATCGGGITGATGGVIGSGPALTAAGFAIFGRERPRPPRPPPPATAPVAAAPPAALRVRRLTAGTCLGAAGGALGARGALAGARGAPAGAVLGVLLRPRPPREPRRRGLAFSPPPPPCPPPGAPPASGLKKTRLSWEITACPPTGPKISALIIAPIQMSDGCRHGFLTRRYHVQSFPDPCGFHKKITARQDRLSHQCTNSHPPVKLHLALGVCPPILLSLL
jgi:hypothetical protein